MSGETKHDVTTSGNMTHTPTLLAQQRGLKILLLRGTAIASANVKQA